MFSAKQFIKLCAVASVVLFILSCAKQNGGSSTKLSVHFPSAKTQANTLTAAAYDFTKACFAVNIIAADIAIAPKKGVCDIPRGIFAGFVAAGGELTLSVPRGSARTLEVFSYLRDAATAPCPMLPDLGTIKRSLIARVGNVAAFDTKDAEATVDVTISAPNSGVNVITQYALPASCNPVAPASQGTARITLAHSRLTGGLFTIDGSVSGVSNQIHLTGQNMKIDLTRKQE